MKRQKQVLRDTGFKNERLEPIGIEVMTLHALHALHERVPTGAERVDFFMLMVVKGGIGSHQVDFERIDLRPGRVVVVRPGQVQQWQLHRQLEADVLLVQPKSLVPGSGTGIRPPRTALLQLEEWPSSFDLTPQQQVSVESLIGMLRAELAIALMTDLSAALASGLLLCVLLGMSRPASRPVGDEPVRTALVRRFQRALDEAIYRRPSVETLAMQLNVSTSTLARHCRAELGRSAKDVVDRRLALEAQRLLVHTPETSVSIGDRLGFSEPTNFLKFFRRVVGATPESFRKTHRLK